MGSTHEVIARRAVVSGRVQGVFFRESCTRRARAEGVAGWVRNRPDGRVEAWFEGAPQAVEKLLTWCREGPAYADVTDLAVNAERPAGLQEFRVE